MFGGPNITETDDQYTTSTCSSPNSYLTGCIPQSNWHQYDGTYPGTLTPVNTFHSQDYQFDGKTCTVQAGQKGAQTNSWTLGNTQCCESPTHAFKCVLRYGGSGSSFATARCGDGYVMTGCSGWGNHKTLNAVYITNNGQDICVARAYTDSYSIYATAICCKLETSSPTTDPTTNHPTYQPTQKPSYNPTKSPTKDPSSQPSVDPSNDPTIHPTNYPSIKPTTDPSKDPTFNPTIDPSRDPTKVPSMNPSLYPSKNPTNAPSTEPSVDPTYNPTSANIQIPYDSTTKQSETSSLTTSLSTETRRIDTNHSQNSGDDSSSEGFTSSWVFWFIICCILILLCLCIFVICMKRRKEKNRNIAWMICNISM